MRELRHIMDLHTFCCTNNGMLVHMHVNSQGYSDGIVLGGPGKFDIDHGARINGINMAISALARESDFARWKGHDIQPRPYDDRERALVRVVRSILSWEACARAEREMDHALLREQLDRRNTARAENLIRTAVADAHRKFEEMYRG